MNYLVITTTEVQTEILMGRSIISSVKYLKEGDGIISGDHMIQPPPGFKMIDFDEYMSLNYKDDVDLGWYVVGRLPQFNSKTPLILKSLRINQALDTSDVEDHLGLSRGYLKKLEGGQISSPSYNIIAKLVNLYKIPSPTQIWEQ